MDVGPAQNECEADVPACLGAGAEDGDGVDAVPAVEDHCAGESGAEGCQLFSGEESVGESGRREQS